MAHITTHSNDFRLSAPKFGNFELVLKFFADGIRDMNRYLDAASFVRSADRPERMTGREQSWEGPF